MKGFPSYLTFEVEAAAGAGAGADIVAGGDALLGTMAKLVNPLPPCRPHKGSKGKINLDILNTKENSSEG